MLVVSAFDSLPIEHILSNLKSPYDFYECYLQKLYVSDVDNQLTHEDQKSFVLVAEVIEICINIHYISTFQLFNLTYIKIYIWIEIT